VPNDYGKVYPSLHLSYHLTDEQELQLNYSHRVRRPESDELNPFVDYSDPSTLRAGNPLLRPEDTHSFEAGYQFRRDKLSFLSTVYHRIRYNSFTSVTQDQGNGVLLTTQQNLGQSDATGLEIATTAELHSKLSVNFSSNVYFNTIDASNLGFRSSKSDVSWSAKASANYHLTKDTLVQFNTNYTSARLTPQGSRRPTYYSNLGLRHEFYQKKLAAILTISDLFNHLKEINRFDTPGLQGESVRRRSPRIVYAGLTYYFGRQTKKTKDDAIKFEEPSGG
jgi:outer membrane receptor protein involved in Fe transport